MQLFKQSLSHYRDISNNRDLLVKMDNSFIENAFKRSIERSVSKSPGDETGIENDSMNRNSTHRQSLLDLNKLHKHISQKALKNNSNNSQPFGAVQTVESTNQYPENQFGALVSSHNTFKQYDNSRESILDSSIEKFTRKGEKFNQVKSRYKSRQTHRNHESVGICSNESQSASSNDQSFIDPYQAQPSRNQMKQSSIQVWPTNNKSMLIIK